MKKKRDNCKKIFVTENLKSIPQFMSWDFKALEFEIHQLFLKALATARFNRF